MSTTNGTVEWLNYSKGFGFIKQTSGADVLLISVQFQAQILKH